MKNFLVCFGFATALSTTAHSQQLEGDFLCSELIQPLLSMVSSVEEIPQNFEVVYFSLSAADQARFADVKARGEEMGRAAEEYRNAFLAACYGN